LTKNFLSERKGSLKVTVFWDVAPSSIRAYLLHLDDDDKK
jgi:hypothetical protein